MRNVYVYTFIISFALGIALYAFFSFGWSLIGILLLLAFVTILKSNKSVQAILVLMLLIGFAFGSARMLVANQSALQSDLSTKLGQKVEMTGIISSEPDRRAKHTNLIVTTQSGSRVLVFADPYTNYKYGDELKFYGKLSRPKIFEADADGRSFDYKRYLAKDDIYYTVFYPHVEILSTGNGNFIKRYLFELKANYLRAIERAIPEPASALAGGITVGAKRALGDTLTTEFRRTGIIHIVVLSGYNVMIIAVFLLFLFSAFSRTVASILSTILIILFVIITGAGATVVRASVMGVLSLLAVELGRTYDALRALFIVGFGMLLVNPAILIADISFHLSFVATLGLIFGMQIYNKQQNPLLNLKDSLKKDGEFDLGVKDILIATVSTQIAVLPLILYYMGDLSLVSIIVNVLVLPVVSVAMLFVFLTGMIGMWSAGIASMFGSISFVLLEYILKVVHFFASLPFASLHIHSFGFGWVVVAYLVIFGFVVTSIHNTKVNVV